MKSPTETPGGVLHVRFRLSSESNDALAALFGAEPGIAISDSLDVDGSFFRAPRFAFPSRPGYVEIRATAKESPRSSFTYHELSARVVRHPTGVPEATLGDSSRVVGAPSSTVFLGAAKGPIERIFVIEHREIESNEVIAFDSALIFERAKGGAFGIRTPGVLLDAVELSLDPDVVEEMKRMCQIREVLPVRR